MRANKLPKPIRIGFWVLIGLTVCLSACAVFNQIATSVERGRFPAPGQLVSVGGRKLHVYRSGSGERTLVLLSGLGTPAPVHDFMPLARELALDSTVIVIEGLGYGYSDGAVTERSNKNIVDEARAALTLAGAEPPYVLLPHSIAGLYSLYWANTYPDEVDAVVGLDISNPAQIDFVPIDIGVNWFGLFRAMGIVRLFMPLVPALMPEYGDELPEDRQGSLRLAAWNYYNDTVWKETAAIRQNSLELRAKVFPPDVPVRLVVAEETVRSVREQFDGRDWIALQEKLIEGHPDARILTLTGSHYIHHGNAAEIRKLIGELPR